MALAPTGARSRTRLPRPKTGGRLDANGAVAGFVIAFIAVLIVALLHSPKIFYYDSGGYWGLGETSPSTGTSRC